MIHPIAMNQTLIVFGKFNLMIMYRFFLICWVSMLLISVANAQITERERPEEWNNLVHGGRFMDLFLPMKVQGTLTSDTWGADNVIPRYTENGLEDNEWSYWGGNALLGDDGKYHLYVCRWREDSKKGHHEWRNSIVVHAISDQPTGPYTVSDTVGAGHNPEVFQLKDGRYVIYVIDGYYISTGLNGPWDYAKFKFENRDRKIIEGLSNLTFAQREDGSFLMICRGGGVWFSETGISPYHQVTDKRVYPPVDGRFEDPVVWRDQLQYHLIVNDWLGRIAYYLRSKDGIHWKIDPGEAYLPGIAKYEDGTVVDWFKYERIKVLQDGFGRATQAHFAVIDVLKNDDKSSDKHSSKHICIPLTVGRHITILNQEPVSNHTDTIRVKLSAEDGFNPNTDIDLYSLRFGASEEVNFGRGSKAIAKEESGNDLILTFDSSGNGLTETNFVAKLVGKTKDGALLFGYAGLPGINYTEPALSARLPVITLKSNEMNITIEVQNFGQVASEVSDIKILQELNDKEIELTAGKISMLEPFEKMKLELTSDQTLQVGESFDIKVIIKSPDQKPVTLQGKVIPE